MRLASHSLASAVANAQPAARVLPRPSVCIFCQQNSFLPRSQPLSTSAHRRTSPLNPIVSRPRTREHEVVFRHASIRHASTSRVVEPVEESNDILLDEAQAREDARRYKLQLQRDEKTAQQAEVENAPNHQDYVPATTWDGLEMVGGEKEWDAGRKFKSFLPKTKFETPEELTIAVYRAVVEIFAAYTAGRTPRTSQTYHVGPLVNEALQVKVNHDINSPGKVTLEYPSKAIERAVLKAGQTKSQDPDVSASAPAETLVTNASRTNLITSFNDTTIKPATQDTTTEDLAKIIASLGHSWLHIPLTDPKIKFALIKRITRITGVPVPDNLITTASTVSKFILRWARPKPSARLYDALVTDEKLQGLGNVQVLGRRVTPIDRDMEVGRWKVIERELRRRELPVVGHG